jgi:phosphoenolpyruvate-protein kinase (PTS system EI component)
MIEVPSAVAMAAQLASEVDFFSVGTNDLAQYAMAADRGNTHVAGLVTALQPAVLHFIKQTADAAHAAGIWVGVCGELGADATATTLLIGLGVDKLSMSASAIPAVKEAVRASDFREALQLAEQVLALGTVASVRDCLSAR